MRYVPEPQYPEWTPDPDDREAQIAQYRKRLSEWQQAQDMQADEARERRMNEFFDNDEDGER